MSHNQPPSSSGKLWAGRFATPTADLVDAINASIDFDQRMWDQDIRGSLAWARGLGAAGVISADDVRAIEQGLEQIRREIASGQFTFRRDREDIHMNIEAVLRERIGDAGARLHTGRSRNDQVCTDLRLYLRDQIDALQAHLATLLELLATAAEKNAESVIPGYTHLQRAQPITLGYHFMAWAWCLYEDLERLRFARRQTNRSPLGSAALAGSAYPVDRQAIARDLGFDEALPNGMMATADRGFVLDTLHALATVAVHLSRIGEEIILWNSQEFMRIQLPDAWATGSSIMPQKKNPDVAELLRGKCARVLSAYQTLAVVQKGLPFAYNKDLQEDKEPVFDALDQASLMVRALTGMLAESEFRMPAEQDVAGRGHLLATELADYLARKGIPFRDAHEAVGKVVKLAEDSGKTLRDLTLGQYQSIHSGFAQDLYDHLTSAAAIARRDVYGGTAPARVRESAALLRQKLSA